MGKTRDRFKKIRDTKGTFHAKMGTIKDRNGMDLTEAEDIKKRWQEYTDQIRSDQSLSCVRLFATPWIAARQASLTITNSRSSLRLTEELYKKDLHDPDNHSGGITHLEPDILECEIKWALGSIMMNKARGGDEIPVELFQILKDDAVKVLHSICQQIWKTQQPQDWKRVSFHSNPKERQYQRMLKHNCTHLTC